MNGGTLFVVSAPSGAGKTSLVNALVDRLPAISLSVSHTTRPARPGEQGGQHYFFVDDGTFDRMIEADAFLEHARVFDHRYGTAAQPVRERLDAGEDVILEIDWQGARQARTAIEDAVSIFILPPSRATLVERLQSRGQDSEDIIAGRMAAADEELSHHGEFDYLVVNDDFETALSELSAIVTARRLRLPIQQRRHRDLLADLTGTPVGSGDQSQ